MNAKEILCAYAARAPWLTQGTVDKIVYGDPDAPVEKLLVTWQIDFDTIRYAAGHGFSAIMTHEPTFYFHENEWESVLSLPEGSHKKRVALEKAAMLDRHGIVVLRNHDVWDAMPEVGIPWAWARFLGLEGMPAVSKDAFQLCFEIAPVSASALLSNVAMCLRRLSDETPALFGPPKKMVRRLGIGTGCITRVETFLEMGCDAALLCDDGVSFWQDIRFALDAGLCAVRVSHATSEAPGVYALSEDARCAFPDIYVEYYPFNLNARLPG